MQATRREFLCASAAAAASVLRVRASGGDTAPVLIRRSVFSPSAPIAEYRVGVKVMKSRSLKDPTSWLYQANMHGTYTSPPASALWNQCQHGSFFFLSWHRMYLYWFERILRKACGDAGFALPYWNYTSTAPSARQLPLSFREVQVAGSPNALYHQSRAPGMNDPTNPAQLPYSATLYSPAFSYTNFESPGGSGVSFGGQVLAAPAHFTGPHGQLESQPHDVIHGLVGGPGDMGDPNRAARDPIFWLHHANIDRLWIRWLQQGGRSNPTGNDAWMTTVFKFFDEGGKEVKMKGADILDPVAQLQYRYDDDPVVLGPATAIAGGVRRQKGPKAPKGKPMLTVATGNKAGLALGGQPVHTTVALKDQAKDAVKRLVAAAPATAADRAIILRLDDVTFDKQPGIYYEVYLNAPADEDSPDFHNGHYVGNLGFFAKFSSPNTNEHEKGAVGAKANYAFDISGLVRAMSEKKTWDPDKVTISFVPRGLEDSKGHALDVKTEAKITVGKITLIAQNE